MGLIVQKTGIPAVVVRLRRRLLETSFKGQHSIEKGDVVALISDVATSGGGIIKAVEKIKTQGAEVPVALVLIKRGGEELDSRLESAGIELFYADEAKEAEDLTKEPMKKFIEAELKEAK